MAIELISKLEAATRQLDMAIVSYFQDADPLSVHTLAGAAHRLLDDLLVKRGGESNVRPRDKSGRSAHLNFVAVNVIKAINFLKHAEHDADRLLTFNPDWTDFLVFDAIRMHIDLAGPKALIGTNSIFLLWLSAKYPNVALLDRFADAIGAANHLAELKRIFPALGKIDVKKRIYLSALNTGPPQVPATQ